MIMFFLCWLLYHPPPHIKNMNRQETLYVIEKPNSIHLHVDEFATVMGLNFIMFWLMLAFSANGTILNF